VLAVDGFEGPLDWLLELARGRRIDLARLSIAALVVDAFAAALTAALADADPSAMILERWSDWLVMAADLILLRARTGSCRVAAGSQLGARSACRKRGSA